MMISARAEYACLAILHLSAKRIAGEHAPVPVHRIAEITAVPEKYLLQILIQLQSAKFVRSVRGANGGTGPGGPPQPTHHRLDDPGRSDRPAPPPPADRRPGRGRPLPRRARRSAARRRGGWLTHTTCSRSRSGPASASPAWSRPPGGSRKRGTANRSPETPGIGGSEAA